MVEGYIYVSLKLEILGYNCTCPYVPRGKFCDIVGKSLSSIVRYKGPVTRVPHRPTREKRMSFFLASVPLSGRSSLGSLHCLRL